MSVFGGDSWAREAQQRKRRVEHLLLTESSQSSSFHKLSNGIYTCLICPHNPLIDSPLFFSRIANVKHEINKRIALSSDSVSADGSCSSSTKAARAAKPLIAQTLKATSEILGQATQSKFINERSGVRLNSSQNHVVSQASSCTGTGNTNFPVAASAQMAVLEHINYRERRERELKFTAAGWKRDCHGKWFKDDNVEFDSDEEDPNVCLG